MWIDQAGIAGPGSEKEKMAYLTANYTTVVNYDTVPETELQWWSERRPTENGFDPAPVTHYAWVRVLHQTSKVEMASFLVTPSCQDDGGDWVRRILCYEWGENIEPRALTQYYSAALTALIRKDKAPGRIAAFDLEVTSQTAPQKGEALVLDTVYGWSYTQDGVNFHTCIAQKGDELETNTMVGNIILHMFQEGVSGSTVYAHNAGRFDFVYVL